ELRRLFQTIPGVSQVAVQGDNAPQVDYAVQIFSLPHLMHTTLATIPTSIPYFTPDPADVERWRHRLENDTNIKIGLVWSGKPGEGHADYNLRREIPLSEFA